MKRLRSSQEGAGLVELALVVPILMLLVAGIWEFGHVLDAQVVLNNAAREGGRYAALGYSVDDVRDRVDAYFNRGLGSSRLGGGGDVAFNRADVTVTNAAGVVGNPVVVTVPITVRFWVPGLLGLPDTIRLRASETMTLQCGGVTPC